jgi:hypothetical protein
MEFKKCAFILELDVLTNSLCSHESIFKSPYVDNFSGILYYCLQQLLETHSCGY